MFSNRIRILVQASSSVTKMLVSVEATPEPAPESAPFAEAFLMILTHLRKAFQQNLHITEQPEESHYHETYSSQTSHAHSLVMIRMGRHSTVASHRPVCSNHIRILAPVLSLATKMSI